MAMFLSDNFGKYSYGKYIAEWIKYLPKNLKMKLVEGYIDGDGSYVGKTITASSVSMNLLEGIQDILFSCGIVSSISNGTNGGEVNIFGKVRNSRPSYHLRMTSTQVLKYISLLGLNENIELSRNSFKKNIYISDDNKYIYLKVRKVSKSIESGKVYNFETESESHTFCSRFIASHNCDPSRGTSADRTSPTVLAISHPVTTTSAIRRIHIGCRGIHQDLLRLDII